jgi:hypothetical protein
MDLMKPLDANVMKARLGPLEPSTAHKPSANQKSAASNKYSQSQSYDQVRNATD